MLSIKRGRRKEDASDRDTEYDDVIENATEFSGTTNTIEMKANEAYGTHQQQNNNTVLETSVEAYYYEELS